MTLKMRAQLWTLNHRLKKLRRERELNNSLLHATLACYFDAQEDRTRLDDEEKALLKIRAEIQTRAPVPEVAND
jgi:2'-5' RNA ligase